jgi:hypothetical protein
VSPRSYWSDAQARRALVQKRRAIKARYQAERMAFLADWYARKAAELAALEAPQ